MLDAVPRASPPRQAGEATKTLKDPSGCGRKVSFTTRGLIASTCTSFPSQVIAANDPKVRPVEPNSFVSCHVSASAPKSLSTATSGLRGDHSLNSADCRIL